MARRCFLAGFIAGVATSVSLFLLNQPMIAKSLGMRPLFHIQAPYLYCSIWAFLATIVVTCVISYFSRSDSPEKLRYTIRNWKPSQEGSA